MSLLSLKLRNDKGNKAVFIIRHVHHIKVLTEEILDRFHLDRSHDLTLGNAGLADLTLLAEHIRELRIVGLNCCSTVLDGDFLLVDKQSNNCSNVDLSPAIRDSLIAALYIKHGGRQLSPILHDQVFLDLGSCITIGFCSSNEVASQNLDNVRIRLCILLDQAKLTVDVRHQILQSLINAGLCVTALYLNMLTVHIEGCIHNGFLQILHSGQLIPASFILLVTDDVLHGLRKLGDVPLLHELADLHGTFQRLIVRSTRKNDDSLPLRFRHKAQFRFLHGIGCDRQEAQLHTTSHCTRGYTINHLVEVEVILAVAVFLSLVDISVDHLSNALNDRRSIHIGILDILLDVLLLIGQEVISVAGSANVVLAHEPVQGLSDLLAENDLICADIVSHQDNNVVHVGRDVIHIADQVQELQNINVHSLDSRANIRCVLAALDHTANGTVKEGMYGIVEAEERNQRVFVLILNLLRGFLETG